MKVESTKVFTPITLTVTLETEAELLDLLARTDVAPGHVNAQGVLGKADYDSCDHLYDVLVAAAEAAGIELSESTPADPDRSAPVVDWSKAPDWARYYAVDANGSAFFYSDKPKLQTLSWMAPEGSFQTAPGRDWQETLVERPDNG